jgi:hypothetical protein
VAGDAAVAEAVSAGDDVYIVSKDGSYPEQVGTLLFFFITLEPRIE